MTPLPLHHLASLFERDLEEQVKRYSVEHFAADCVTLLEQYRSARRPVLGMQFRAAHAIEANFAYFRRGREMRLDDNGYRKIFNVFHAHEDHGLLALLHQSVDLFFLCMYRQQMEFQVGVSPHDYARYLRLFLSGSPMKNLDEEFSRAHAMTIEEWLRASFGAFVILSQAPFHEVNLRPPYCEQVSLRPEALVRYFAEASATPEEIGRRYRRLREGSAPEQRAVIRSAFFESPIVRYDGDRHLSPFPELLFHHGATGLYRRIKGLPAFDREFGDSVERYVGFVLSQLPDSRVIPGAELRPLCSGLNCDFLVDRPDEILLVEAKATTFTRNVLSEKTIRADGSTLALGHAGAQLHATAHDLRRGRFARIGVLARERPISLIAATFGEIVFSNSPWYRATFLSPLTEKELRSSGQVAVPEETVVLSLSTLELAVSLLREASLTFSSLVARKQELSYVTVGDWDTFLEQVARDTLRRIPALPTVRDDWHSFIDRFRG
jgi:hypothetical protein